MPFRRRIWLPGSRKRHASWRRCPWPGKRAPTGKLGALSSGLTRAFDDHIELSLRAGAGTHVRTEEVQALANGLAEETSCRVLAWSVCRNHVHVIAELTEEKGVDELVCSWKALAPSMNWEDAYHTEALKAREPRPG